VTFGGPTSSLNPQDAFRLQSIAAFAAKQPDPDAAIKRGVEFINSPDASFAGHTGLASPQDFAAYNDRAAKELLTMYGAHKSGLG
jgi:hypothetical protein